MQDKPLAVKAVIWDYGNTLVLDPFPKTIERIAISFTKKINCCGYPILPPDFKKAITRANRDIDYPFCTHFSQEEPIIQEALKSLGVKPEHTVFLGPEFLQDYRNALNELLKNDPRMKPVRAVLDHIKKQGIAQAVFSNDRRFCLINSLGIAGLIGSFDLVRASEEIGIEKPDLQVFDYVLKKFELKPEDAVYIGDDPKRDVEASKTAGMRAILVERPKEESMPWRDLGTAIRYEPDFVIKDLKEIIDRKLIVLKK